MFRWDEQSPTTILLDVAHPGMPIIAVVVGGGHKAGTIMTQGESACPGQQAETPTGC